MALKKRRLTCDVEIYINYFLVAFRDKDTGDEFGFEVKGDEQVMPRADRTDLKKIMTGEFIITFNGINFDVPMIWLALTGHAVWQIKEVANKIIEQQVKYWEIEKEYGIKFPRNLDHIDLIEVAPGQASLKIYNGRNHGRHMQDLPIEPAAELTDEEAEETYHYCFNDLDATEGLFNSLESEIQLRNDLTMEYGIDLRSKSDAQVAEAIIKMQVGKITGTVPKKPNIPQGRKYKYEIPDFIEFRHPVMLDVLDRMRRADFVVAKSGKIETPPEFDGHDVHLGYGTYRIGTGGLHSSEKTQTIVPKKGWILRDSDVTSYYPRIIINLGLYPRHMGAAFLRVYKGIVDRRVKAKQEVALIYAELEDPEIGGNRRAMLLEDMKREQTAADGGKIMVNGSFGKFGSKYSALYSPDLLIQTTITGQLSLLMLIEWLEEEGIQVVSANTDGVVAHFPEEMEDLYNQIIKDWEKQTGFNMEFTNYAGLYSRDVNSYLAITTGGKVKQKGGFSTGSLQTNPVSEISILAVIEFLKNGVNMGETIRNCTDIRKFITVRTVNGGAMHADVDMPNSIIMKQGKFLGKAVRWYYSTDRTSCLYYKKPNASKNHNKVPMSEGAKPMMTMLKRFPDDMDHDYYLQQSRSMLHDVGYYKNVI